MKTVEQMTKEEAIYFAESGKWKTMSNKDLVDFQLYQDLVCVDWGTFCLAMNDVFGRPVFTHEYADRNALRKEFETLR